MIFSMSVPHSQAKQCMYMGFSFFFQPFNEKGEIGGCTDSPGVSLLPKAACVLTIAQIEKTNNIS